MRLPAFASPHAAVRVLLLMLFGFSSMSSAQLVAAEQKGLPSNGVFHGGDVDVVNIQNGNLYISIPILSRAQRGGDTA